MFNLNLNSTNLPGVRHPKASSLHQHLVLWFLNHPGTASQGEVSPYHLQETLQGQLTAAEDEAKYLQLHSRATHDMLKKKGVRECK